MICVVNDSALHVDSHNKIKNQTPFNEKYIIWITFLIEKELFGPKLI